MSVVVWLPSMMSSLIPVTMTSWAVSQLALVNVNSFTDVPLTWASPVSPDDTWMTTFEPGWALRTTVNVSVEPDSETTVEPSEAATVIPATARIVIWLVETVSLSFSLRAAEPKYSRSSSGQAVDVSADGVPLSSFHRSFPSDPHTYVWTASVWVGKLKLSNEVQFLPANCARQKPVFPLLSWLPEVQTWLAHTPASPRDRMWSPTSPPEAVSAEGSMQYQRTATPVLGSIRYSSSCSM